MTEIIFLGTSSMIPTKERNHSSVYLKHDNLSLLFDCGEGTQRQMKFAGIKPSKIKDIFITHWHGDHVLGLPGMLQTIASSVKGCEDCEQRKVRIFGPVETEDRIKHMLKAFSFQSDLDIEIEEIKGDGCVFENGDVVINAYYLEHSVPCVGYSFTVKDQLLIDKNELKKLGIKEGPELKKLKEKKDIVVNGKKHSYKKLTRVKKGYKIGYAVDTRPCNGLIKIAENCDVLIAESTYGSKNHELAVKNFHMTAKEIALIASQNNVSKLIITHFSQRYKSVDTLLNEARDYFPNTVAAYDFMKVKI